MKLKDYFFGYFSASGSPLPAPGRIIFLKLIILSIKVSSFHLNQCFEWFLFIFAGPAAFGPSISPSLSPQGKFYSTKISCSFSIASKV